MNNFNDGLVEKKQSLSLVDHQTLYFQISTCGTKIYNSKVFQRINSEIKIFSSFFLIYFVRVVLFSLFELYHELDDTAYTYIRSAMKYSWHVVWRWKKINCCIKLFISSGIRKRGTQRLTGRWSWMKINCSIIIYTLLFIRKPRADILGDSS